MAAAAANAQPIGVGLVAPGDVTTANVTSANGAIDERGYDRKTELIKKSEEGAK